MNVRLNVGMMHQYPLESHYSIFRRFKASNLLMSANDFTRYFIWRNARQYKQRLKIVLDLNFGDVKHLEDYYKQINQQALDERKFFKHCSKCARLHYHSVIHNLPWIENCPIHNILLTKICKYCDTNLNLYRQTFRKTCPECGLFSTKYNVSQQAELTKKINYILVPIYEKYIQNNYQDLKVINISGQHNNLLSEANVLSGQFLPVVGITQPHDKKLKHSLSIPAIKKRRGRCQSSYIPLSNIEEQDCKSSVFQSLTKYINDMHAPKYRQAPFNYKQLRLTNFFKSPCICSFCLSIGFWTESVNDHFNQRSFFDDAIFLSEHEKDRLRIINFKYEETSTLSRLSKTTIKWLFKRVLKSHFFNIMAVLLEHEIENIRFDNNELKAKLLKLYRFISLNSQVYLKEKTKDEINLYYIKWPDLQELAPTFLESELLTENCSQFHSLLIKEKWILSN